MKKIVLLILIAIAIPVIIIVDTNKDANYYYEDYPDLPKDENWEGLKKTLFSNVYNPKMNLRVHKGPVLVSLHDASSKDSMLVNNAIKKLKTLIPYKTIDYFKNYTGVEIGTSYDQKNTFVKGCNLGTLESLTINLYFKDSLKVNKNLLDKKELETSIDREYTYMGGRGLVGHPNLLSGLFKPKVYFDFKEDSDANKRERIIEFGFLKVLACKNEFRGMLSMYEPYTAKKERMNEIRTIFSKLYTPNIFKDFKVYLYKTYPWRYASNYLNNQKTKALALWVCVSLAIILFWIGFGLLYKKNFKYQYLAYFLPVLFFMITVLYVYKTYNYIAIPSSFEHWRQYISIHAIFIIIASIIALLLKFFDKFFIKNNMGFTMQLVLKVGFTFLVCLSPVVIIFLLENNHNGRWFQLNPLLLSTLLAFTFGRGLLLYLDYFSENLVKQKDVELNQLKERNAQAQVQLLQSQINPHFLYNALNSIASLASVDSKKTRKMAHSLSHLFKYSINRNSEKMSKVSDEVTMVKTYLEIEQIRFGDRLTFEIDVDKTLESVEIPKFIIQPLVENAVKHGVSQIEEQGTVSLTVRKASKGIEIQVKDNGPHFPEDLISGHGLQTVYDLLQLTYGNKASLNWQNEPEKVITILIP